VNEIMTTFQSTLNKDATVPNVDLMKAVEATVTSSVSLSRESGSLTPVVTELIKQLDQESQTAISTIRVQGSRGIITDFKGTYNPPR